MGQPASFWAKLTPFTRQLEADPDNGALLRRLQVMWGVVFMLCDLYPVDVMQTAKGAFLEMISSAAAAAEPLVDPEARAGRAGAGHAGGSPGRHYHYATISVLH
jgi:hypothetical protein